MEEANCKLMFDSMPLDKKAITDLVPGEVLRAAMNLGNPNLARQRPSGELFGLSVDLATELSRRLSLPIKFINFPGAGRVFEAASSNIWDVAFLAADSVRASVMRFTTPYGTLSGSFVVRAASKFLTNGEIDQQGVRIVVGKGSAYDLYLSQAMRRASLVRVPTSMEVLPVMMREHYEVAAGVRQQLEEQVRDNARLRILDGRFMAINQALASRRDCTSGFDLLQRFVEAMIASGFVRRSLLEHGVKGVDVTDPVAI